MDHGGDLTAAMARHGGVPADWLDLSTGINPHPYPLPPLDARVWAALPSRAALQAFEDLARQAYGAPGRAGLVAAPGTQALIQWLPQVLAPGSVAVLGPTYAEHALSWRRAGRCVRETDEPVWPDGVRHLVIVRPNNPDGRLLPLAAMRELAEEARRRAGTLIVDESFIDCVPEETCAGLVAEAPVIVLRSFGKFYGLAGVRLGAAIAPAEIAAAIARALGSWAVAGPALAIGAAALADIRWRDAMRARLGLEASRLDGVLGKAGLSPAVGTPLYRLVRHADAWAIQDGLAARRIWVRRFDWDTRLLRFGLPADETGLARLAAALGALVPALAHSTDHGSTTRRPSTSG